MIDFHSHALPGIDDGAADEKISAAMLEMSKKQGVDTVVLTPHYYAHKMSVEEFLEKRDASYQRLIDYVETNNIEIPKLIKGAEVKFSYELLKSEDIKKLVLENTDYLLLEMPFSYWNSWIFDKLFEFVSLTNINLIIAHAERYVRNMKQFSRLQPFFDMNLTIQVNSDSVFRWGKRRIVKRLINENQLHLIGSDMHNNTSRKTSVGKAFSYISRKFGNEVVREIEERGKSLIE